MFFLPQFLIPQNVDTLRVEEWGWADDEEIPNLSNNMWEDSWYIDAVILKKK